MSTFRRCMKDFDKVPDVYNYYGELLLDQQKYSEAIQNFDTAIEMEKQTKPMGMNVLPLINKALALFQWKQDYGEAEKLCGRALLRESHRTRHPSAANSILVDPDCDIAVATMAQLLLQQGKVNDALEYFERAASLSRTEPEIVNALSYAEATRTQLQVSDSVIHMPSGTDNPKGPGEVPSARVKIAGNGGRYGPQVSQNIFHVQYSLPQNSRTVSLVLADR